MTQRTPRASPHPHACKPMADCQLLGSAGHRTGQLPFTCECGPCLRSPLTHPATPSALMQRQRAAPAPSCERNTGCTRAAQRSSKPLGCGSSTFLPGRRQFPIPPHNTLSCLCGGPGPRLHSTQGGRTPCRCHSPGAARRSST